MEAVLFIGAPGSGKSTFYVQRFVDSHVRISRDILKTRNRERVLLHACLQAGIRFVVDNTNVTRAERARYIAPALAAGFVVKGFFFQAPLAELLRRNASREGRQRIPDAGVRGRLGDLEPPDLAEGFAELTAVRIGPGGRYELDP